MASAFALPPLPPHLKAIAHMLKTATEHETRDPVVTYWSRLAALQTALPIDKKSKEATAVLIPLMDWLEKEKKVLAANEAVSSDIVASAHLENYAMKLFSWADKEDRAGKFGKNVVKAFYTAGVLFDVMQVSFGELTPENTHARKYSKWKAAYIHNCLKNGETPIAGPVGDEDDDDVLSAPTDPSLAEEGGAGGWSQPPSQPQPPTYAQPPAPVVAPQPVAPPRPSAAAEAPSNKQLTPEQLMKAQKLCKYASSALDYDDVKTAIKNLNEALDLLMSTQQ